jgi:hypothetical protein
MVFHHERHRIGDEDELAIGTQVFDPRSDRSVDSDEMEKYI